MTNAEKMCIFPTPIKKEFDKDCGYIYFCKIVNYKNNIFYKIGFSKNLKQRMDLLRYEHAGEYGGIELLAYGETDKMRSTEFHMHDKFYKQCYSFLYSAKIPKWSYEYFNLDYNEVCSVIFELKKCCSNVKYVVDISLKNNTFPPQRCLPYVTNDLGYWETRELICRCRSGCIGTQCSNYALCRSDMVYAHCD